MKEIYATFLILYTCRAFVTSVVHLATHQTNALLSRRFFEEGLKSGSAQYAESVGIILGLALFLIQAKLMQDKLSLILKW